MEEVAEQSFDAMSAYLLLQEKVTEKLNEGSRAVAQDRYGDLHRNIIVKGG